MKGETMKELYLDAAIACKNVYDIYYDIGSVQFDIRKRSLYGAEKPFEYQILSIAGTNEFLDWPKNINMMSWKGIKKAAYDAAILIKESVHFYRNREEGLPLIVTGHSKGGSTAIAFHKLFGAGHCIAFAPARCLRYWTKRTMENTSIFLDPDDLVSWLGRISFGHPICKLYEARDDHWGFDIGDHSIDNWIEFTKNL
jgi:hypothetical protein